MKEVKLCLIDGNDDLKARQTVSQQERLCHNSYRFFHMRLRVVWANHATESNGTKVQSLRAASKHMSLQMGSFSGRVLVRFTSVQDTLLLKRKVFSGVQHQSTTCGASSDSAYL